MLIMIIFLLLGCVMDSLAIILICVPLFVPIVLANGFDLIWFGIIVVVVTEIALITPPIGMNVFVLKATRPNVSFAAIFKGLVPFRLSIGWLGRFSVEFRLPFLNFSSVFLCLKDRLERCA